MKPVLLLWFSLRPPVKDFSATDEQVTRWRARVPELEIIHAKSQEEFVKNLSKATYVITYHFAQTWCSLAYRLKWIATPAAGKEVLGADIPDRIRLTNGTFHGRRMAETALGMLLSVRRGLLPGLGLCSPESPWPEGIRGLRALDGSHAVILGYGNIGRHIGRLLEGLNVRVTGVRRANLDKLDGLLPTADALFLALPATPETDKILNAERLALLPPHAVVINVGRGNAIDEDALSAALREKRLHAAFLDVASEEPYPADGQLLHTERCFLMPHVSAVAPDYLDLAFDEWMEIYERDYKAQQK